MSWSNENKSCASVVEGCRDFLYCVSVQFRHSKLYCFFFFSMCGKEGIVDERMEMVLSAIQR